MLRRPAIANPANEDHNYSFQACLKKVLDAPSANNFGSTEKLQRDHAVHSQEPPMVRPTAPFLMHLIATAQGAPQTRVRRRADPDQAIATYAAAMQKPTSARTGRGFARSR
jgi:hypothetical protein